MRNKILPLLFLFFASGILAAAAFKIDFIYLLTSALVLGLLAFLFSREKFVFYFFICWCTFTLGVLVFYCHQDTPHNHIKNLLPKTPAACFVQGWITSNPEDINSFNMKKKSRFVLRLEKIKYHQGWVGVGGRVMVTSLKDFDYAYGQYIVIEGMISRPRPPDNPAGFDYPEYLKRQKIHASLFAGERAAHLLLCPEAIEELKLEPRRLQDKFSKIINQSFHPPYAALYDAILLGRRSNLDQEIKDNFIKTGTMHMLAISGLHIGIVVFLILGVLKLCRVRRKLRIITTMFVLLIYALICRERPSVLRAVIMSEVFMLGWLLMRRITVAGGLSLAGIFLLTKNPYMLQDAGFLLSFASVFSIIYLSSLLEDFFHITYAPKIRRRDRVWNYFKKATVISTSVFIGIWPIIAYFFNTVSWISVMVNILVIPILFLVVSIGMLLLIFGTISPIFSQIFADLGMFFMQIILKITAVFAKFPLGFIHVPSPTLIFIIFYYLVIFVVFNHERLRVSKAKALILVIMFINLCLGVKIYNNLMEDDKLKVIFFSLGNSDAICLQFPHQQAILIDTGGSYEFDVAGSVLLPYLWQQGINRINAVIITHPHYDHLGGIFGLSANARIDNIFENGQRMESAFYKKYEKLLKDKKIKRYILHRGDKIKGFKNTEIEVFHPSKEFFEQGFGVNNNSLVLKVRYKNFTMLLCADIMKEAIMDLLKNESHEELGAVVYKAPHHGKEWRDDDKLELIIDPEITIITQKKKCGEYAENRNIFSTAECGAVIITVSDNGYRVEPFLADSCKAVSRAL
ncbi:MAG: DNA internalization-related competence protein ComEC/Rec2 [Candidatus Omnitrophota bacterium]